LIQSISSRAEFRTDIEFAKIGPAHLTLDANIPDGQGPFPIVILVHGGGWTRGDKQTFIKPLFDPLTKAGFTWFTINYRLAPQNRFPDCVEDVETAIRWVKTHASEYKGDPRRIALVGESAGGHLVSLAGVRAKKATRVAAVVPFYAPHDLELQVQSHHELGTNLCALFGVTEMNDATSKTLRKASPTSYLTRGLPPFLLIHGTQDKTVPYEQSTIFQEKMKAKGNVCDLISIDGGGHGMGGWDKAHPEYKDQLVEWLKQKLK
jgi:alpha-L-fucosidase 2